MRSLTFCLLFFLSMLNVINAFDELPGSITEICSIYTDCSTCSTLSDCGFCSTSKQCIPGGWFEPLNVTDCQPKDYLYRQCYVPNTHVFRGVVLSLVVLLLLVSSYSVWICLASIFSSAEKVYLLPQNDRRVSYSAVWEEPEAEPEPEQSPSTWESWFIHEQESTSMPKQKKDQDSIETSSTTSSILGGSPETGTWLARKRDLIEKYLNSGYRRH
ncbi:hypothetical protein K7432_005985 [Basidiobolus ranarum]|uniref:PSI domain-containing protein n=1 Tax=Basidiobolus ranarum TaxID=34480 RepID=A0ABR2WVQ5_9FUNG